MFSPSKTTVLFDGKARRAVEESYVVINP